MTNQPFAQRLLLLTVLGGATVFSPGCDMANFAAGSTVKVIVRGSPALGRLNDVELAEAAIPGSIGTMEAVFEIRPDDTKLRTLLARSYASYGFGFMEDHMEEAYANDDEEKGEHFRQRASLSYLRAKEIALGALTVWEDDGGGADGHIKKGVDAWAKYLKKFDDAEDQAPVLFWGAYSWARWVSLNTDNPDALADLPFVNALADRALALDPTFNFYAPKALHAGLIGTAPAQLGGRPADAKVEFEAAIAATNRTNLIYLVMEAKICAVALQDRALYKSLLTEVIEAGDVSADLRVSNLIAKKRAVRMLAAIDMLFEPEGTPTDDAVPADAPPVADAPAAPPAVAPVPAAAAHATVSVHAAATTEKATAKKAAPKAAPAPKTGEKIERL